MPMLQKVLDLVRLDFAPHHQQPSNGRVALATVVSIIGSLFADALLVVLAQALWPSTKGYAHFQFADYSKLTIIGVIIACAAWPVTTRITSQPRWMFFRMAVLVTLVLWLPDVYILIQGQSAKAVGCCSSCTWRSRWSLTTPWSISRRSARCAARPTGATGRRSASRGDIELPELRSLGERIGFHGRGAIVSVTTRVTVTT